MRLISLALALAMSQTATTSLANDTTALQDDADRASYSIGLQIGEDLKKQNIILYEDILRKGITDGLHDNPPLVPPREMASRLLKLKKTITSQLNEEAQKKLSERRALEKRIRDAGKTYRQNNATREGVKTTESGLQYKVIKPGDGPTPRPDDYVTVEYSAKTVNGREFDSSAKLGKPAVFRADSILPGFNEAVQLMQPGAKWEVVMPPELAYGRQGLLAHQTIILDLELISIQHQEPEPDTSGD